VRLRTVISYIAQGALAPRQIVKFGTADGTVTASSAATDSTVGVVVSPSAVADGDRVEVARDGLPDVQFGGNVTRGDALTSDANGHAITATRHQHVENVAGAYAQNASTAVAPADRIIGYAEVSAANGDVGEMLLSPGMA
jgi:hypothetical protein